MRFLVALLLCSTAWAGNTCLSAGTGTWQTAATWSACGGVFPGAGDTATIQAGHTVTIPASESDTLGTFGGAAGTNVLTINQNTGVLVNNGTLHLDGDFMMQGTLTLGADSILEFGNIGYTWHSDTNFGSTAGNNNLIQTSGTSLAHPFTIRTTSGGTNVSVTINNHAANKMNLSFGTFLRIGSSTLKAYQFATGGGSSAVFQTTITLTNVTFDSCGQVAWTNAAPDGGGWAFSNVHFTNTAAAIPLLLNATGLTGTRTMDKTTFDKAPTIIGANAIYTRNVFTASYANTSSTADWAQFGEAAVGDGFGNFVRCKDFDSTVTTCGNIAGNMIGNYILIDGGNAPAVTGTATSASNSTNTGTLADTGKSWTVNGFQSTASANNFTVYITGGTGVGQARSIVSNTATVLTTLYQWTVVPNATSTYAIVKAQANPHLLNGLNNLNGTSPSLSGNVWENTSSDNNGDLFSHVTKGSTTYTINYNLGLPNAARDNSADIISVDNTTFAVSMIHNTIWGGGQSGTMSSDGAATQTGAFLLWKSNLSVADPAMTNNYTAISAGASSGSVSPGGIGPYQIGSNTYPPVNTDIVSSANADYNGQYGMKAGQGQGYQLSFSSGSPDAHGVSGNPNFTDNTRGFATWAVARGYSVSTSPVTQVSDGLAAVLADGSRVPDLISWVRTGWSPTNSAYHNTAHDGTDIGAVAFSAPLVTFPSAILKPIIW